METKQKKLIIFDFDGVFNLNSMEAYYHTYNQALLESSIEMDPTEQKEIIDSVWGSSHKDILMELLRANAGDIKDPDSIPYVDDESFNKALANYEGVLAEDFPELIKPVPGAPQMLGRLATTRTLALNTAADPEVLLGKVMPNVGIDPRLFQGGMVMALDLIDKKYAKPKPDPYTTNTLMERNKVGPDETIMVGDSGADVETAIYAGIDIKDIYVPLTGKLTADEVREYGVVPIRTVTSLEGKLGGVGVVGAMGGSNGSALSRH